MFIAPEQEGSESHVASANDILQTIMKGSDTVLYPMV